MRDIIDVKNLKTVFDDRVIHEDVTFSVKTGEILAIIGGSGCGKTTLIRTILGLIRPAAGHISVFGVDVLKASPGAFLSVQKRWSVMFQGGALFSSLTVLENILYLLKEYSGLSYDTQVELAKMKIALAGLGPEAAYLYPAELSGGMRKRAALARAIALDPALIFLDEPTAGLDPKSASGLDTLLLEMQKNLGLTFVMVTHDLDTLKNVPNRILFLGEGRVLACEPWDKIVQNKHPAIQAYFSGDRMRG